MCHCGNQKDFDECCGRYINDEDSAPSAEALMRSRYSAFAIADIDYIQATQDSQTLEKFDMKANQQWADSVTFTKLEILRSEENGNKGVVEFQAHFKERETGKEAVHHEVSKFRKQKGIWYYREGNVRARD